MKRRDNTDTSQTLGHLGRLAKHLKPSAGWENLRLAESDRQRLQEIAGRMKHRNTTAESPRQSAKMSPDAGETVLFAGPSGTGKTLAAATLANDLSLDLYQVDLSRVVTKYIGETEKNLKSLFDAAEERGVILLFDEADALFGKRTEVKDSNDRYANVEVSYLLERMESYQGLTILTTNAKSAIDPAVLQRLRSVVDFSGSSDSQSTE